MKCVTENMYKKEPFLPLIKLTHEIILSSNLKANYNSVYSWLLHAGWLIASLSLISLQYYITFCNTQVMVKEDKAVLKKGSFNLAKCFYRMQKNSL